MKRKEERQPAIKRPSVRPSEAGAVAGEVAGAVIGSVAGPVGALAGVVLGGIAGSVAGHVLEIDEERATAHSNELDWETGIDGGDIGTLPPVRQSGAPQGETKAWPAPTRGTLSAPSSGVDREWPTLAEGPIPNVDGDDG
jgi:hypothetical protein